MKKINNLIGIIVSIWSIVLAITGSEDIYGILIQLSVIPIIFAPLLIEKIFSIKINTYLSTIYVIFITLAHFLGSIVDLYHEIYWYDSFTHFLSGIVVSFFATYLLVVFKKYDKKSIIFNILFIFGISFLVAGLWEMFEFTSDKLFGKDAQNVLTTGVDDTMKDMIVAFLGTLLYVVLYIYEEANKRTVVIKKFIDSIRGSI